MDAKIKWGISAYEPNQTKPNRNENQCTKCCANFGFSFLIVFGQIQPIFPKIKQKLCVKEKKNQMKNERKRVFYLDRFDFRFDECKWRKRKLEVFFVMKLLTASSLSLVSLLQNSSQFKKKSFLTQIFPWHIVKRACLHSAINIHEYCPPFLNELS